MTDYSLERGTALLDAHIASQSDMEVILHRGDSITPEPITWLWPGWLAAGKLHILAGAPGTGKTTIALAFAATVTQGGRWPDGAHAAPGNVFVWSGEDDPQDTIVPRLVAMGADRKRIFIVSGIDDNVGRRPFDPATDCKALHAAILREGGASLLIVDPVTSAITGDSHKNAEVRRGLQPLADLAAATDCALLGISHFSKGTAGREPTERVTGSLAFGAFARIVMVTAKRSVEEGGDRVLCRSKSNIGGDSGGFAYDLRQTELDRYPGVEASRVLWGEAIEGTAREILSTAEAEPKDEKGGEKGKAMRFLVDMLSDGAKPQKDIEEFAKAEGLSWATVRRARIELGVESKKMGMGKGWVWRFPLQESSKMLKKHEDAQQKKVGTFGENEHLRANGNEKPSLLPTANGADEIMEVTL